MIARMALAQALTEARQVAAQLRAVDRLLTTPAGRLPARAQLQQTIARIEQGIRRAAALRL